MSGAMVRATLADIKTQTRRVVLPCHKKGCRGECLDWSKAAQLCPYGRPGDRLYVRETWMPRVTDSEEFIQYRADGGLREFPKELNLSEDLLYEFVMDDGKNWRPSIFMPKWAARIWLEITKVRIQELQKISEADAHAEGVETIPEDFYGRSGTALIKAYARLWNSLNAKRGYAWDDYANTGTILVWVITFRRIQL